MSLDKSNLESLNTSLFPSGGAGITAAQLRQFNSEMIQSNLNLIESTNQSLQSVIEMNNRLTNDQANGISEEVILASSSTATSQGPAALDTDHQIEFGPAQGTGSDPVQLLSNGDIVFNKAGYYNTLAVLIAGRTGASGVSHLVLRTTLNGADGGNSRLIFLNDANEIQERTFFNFGFLPAGSIIRGFMYRDSKGNNSGSLVSYDPTRAEYSNVPCARMVVSTLSIANIAKV